MAEANPLRERAYDSQIERRLRQLGKNLDDQSSAIEDEAEFEHSAISILNDPQISQQLTRRKTDGFDTLIGYFRCPFKALQQRFVLHIPLYPAMGEVPEVEAAVVDCDQATTRITDQQKFGLRLEIVLARPSSDAKQLLVEVTAYSRLTS